MPPASAAKAARNAGTSGVRSAGKLGSFTRKHTRSSVIVVDAREDPPIVDSTDSVYRGGGDANSRVKVKDDARPGMQTRYKGARRPVVFSDEDGDSGQDEAEALAQDDSGADEDQIGLEKQGPSGATKRTVSVRKVVTSEGLKARGSAKDVSPSKRRRIKSPSPTRSSPLTEVPSDKEAAVPTSVKRVVNDNEYDLNDPFINDEAIEAGSDDEGSNVGSNEDELAAANHAADQDDGMVDAATLLENTKRSKEERRRVQISLDEQMARDEQSEEEEKLVESVPDVAKPRGMPKARRAQLVKQTDRNVVDVSTTSAKAGPSTPRKAAGGVPGNSAFTPRSKGTTFASAVGSSPSKSSAASGMVHLEDLDTRQVRELPAECEVTDSQLQDPLLRDFYNDLPNLRSGVFESWSDAEGPGMIMFSNWSDACPDMIFETCISAVQFRSSGAFINPSRISPLEVCVRHVPGARVRSHLYTLDNGPAICVSTVMLVNSYLLAPPERGLRQKWLSGIFHSQEWERLVGFIVTVFGYDRLSAQLAKDAIQFTTKAYFGKDRDSRTSGSSMSKMFSKVKSPSTKGKSKAVNAITADTFSLEFDSDVPVYDARDVQLDFNEDLDRIQHLPRWNQEVPYGSFVVVGYTVAVFKVEKTRSWTVSFNIHWAILVGVPSD
ncbi:hypothetical protein BKA70DRAFT_1450893 [Coprinopsis sp. MPI-PUGE-AT-0042]|nr:hypothetical protein BKA70DRAFT_1450893 [Coprinopsis sp. MPI-PUGE-AT-0042]